MIELIAFSGYAGSGKDTAAAGLASLGYERIAFADKVRQFVYTLNPIVGKDVMGNLVTLQEAIKLYGWDGYKKSPWSSTIREYLQKLGTECGRELISETIWIDSALNNLLPGKYVITDCRFPNEAESIRKFDGKIIKIIRPGNSAANGHISEFALNDYSFDETIMNDCSIEEFKERIRQVVMNFRRSNVTK